jgi:hypothetical protein
MPNTPARLTLGLSAAAGNVLTFGADNGLLAPDQITASGAADGPAAFYTVPNHMSAQSDLWWRTWSPNSGNYAYSAAYSVASPVLVTKTARLQAVAAYTASSAAGWASSIVVGAYAWTGQGLKFTRTALAYIPPQTGATGSQYGYFNTYPLLAVGTPYVLVASSATAWTCWSKRNMPGLFPPKATVAAAPADVSTYIGVGMSGYYPDDPLLANIDFDALNSPATWFAFPPAPQFYLRLGAA